MFLFKSDEITHGGCYDYNTSNVSALRMSLLYKKMGIQNHSFLLYLSQPELSKYDPYDLKDNSEELRDRIILETKTNPWYYFRQLVKVQSSGGDDIPFIFNRFNVALIWTYLNSIDSLSCLARQNGKSVTVQSLVSWLFFFVAYKSRFGLVTKDATLVAESVSRLKEIRNSLPKFMIHNLNDSDNQEGLTYNELKNEYITFIAPADRKAARSLGRGHSFIFLQEDEFNYLRNIRLAHPSISACLDTAGEQARANGIPSAKMMTSTWGRLADDSGSYGFELKNKALRFSERLYDMQDHKTLIDFVHRNSKNDTLYLDFHWKLLGKDQAWYDRVTRDKTADEIAVDYEGRWLISSDASILPESLMKRIEHSVIEPVSYSTISGLTVKWYVDEDIVSSEEYRYRNFIFGLDTADNVGEDYTTLVGVDPTDMGVICTARCNIANLFDVVKCIASLLDMFPNSVLIAERNKNGAIMLDILIDTMIKNGQDPFKRLYNTFIQEYSGMSKRLSDIDLSDGRNRKHFGFATTAAADSRNILYGKVLINMLNYMAHKTRDADIVDEIKSLTIRNGRVDHPLGKHDDTTISFLLTGFFALFGKNLTMYGIHSDDILKCISKTGETVDNDAKERQRFIQKRVIELKRLIDDEDNMMLTQAYKRELKHYESMLDNSLLDDEVRNMDQVKQQTQTVYNPYTGRGGDLSSSLAGFF